MKLNWFSTGAQVSIKKKKESLPWRRYIYGYSMDQHNFDNFILYISIITQVIIEILALSLAENGVIFRYNHLRRGDYSGRTNFQNSRLTFCQYISRGN